MVKLVIMVAGMSSRFGGTPKQFAIIGKNNESLIEYSLNEATLNKFNEIIFITNENTEHLFKNKFGYIYNNIPIRYIQQYYDKNLRSRPWGTTDAICCLKQLNNFDMEPFLIINGDDIYGKGAFKDCFRLIENSHKNIIGIVNLIDTLPLEGNVNRGIVKVNNDTVVSIKEYLNINRNNTELIKSYANINFLCLQPNIINELDIILQNFKLKNINENKLEILLPDNLNELIENKKLHLNYFLIKNKIYGITNIGDDIKLKNIFKDI